MVPVGIARRPSRPIVRPLSGPTLQVFHKACRTAPFRWVGNSPTSRLGAVSAVAMGPAAFCMNAGGRVSIFWSSAAPAVCTDAAAMAAMARTANHATNKIPQFSASPNQHPATLPAKAGADQLNRRRYCGFPDMEPDLCRGSPGFSHPETTLTRITRKGHI